MLISEAASASPATRTQAATMLTPRLYFNHPNHNIYVQYLLTTRATGRYDWRSAAHLSARYIWATYRPQRHD